MSSKRVGVLLQMLVVAVVLPDLSRAQTAASPESQIQHIITAQEVAWNVGKSASWTSAFTSDADFINILGQVFHGREAITQLISTILAGPFKGSHTTVTIRQFRQATPDVALIEAVHEVTGYKFLPAGIVPTEEGVLRTRMKYVFVRRDDSWQIIAAQNTSILPQPFAQPATQGAR
jgi:uncharacterized protein (TIGR02246 family)